MYVCMYVCMCVWMLVVCRYEWLRIWRYSPGMRWFAHAPPTLAEREGGRWVPLNNVEQERCLTHDVTRSWGLVFTHHAYSTEKQVCENVVMQACHQWLWLAFLFMHLSWLTSSCRGCSPRWTLVVLSHVITGALQGSVLRVHRRAGELDTTRARHSNRSL